MERKDIFHLAKLARIEITEVEAEALKSEIESVLAYVSVVNDIAADQTLTKKVGARYNVFREDEVTTQTDEYTQTLLNEAPKTKGRYLRVPKIIEQE